MIKGIIAAAQKYKLTMNAIFTAVFIASGLIMCATSPQSFISSLLSGADTAARTALTLFCVYSVWMGLSRVAEDAGINAFIAKKLQPLCTKFFKTKSVSGGQYAAMNVTCNLLGLGGAATPFGVKAIKRFDAEGNMYGRNMLFIINAASVQIIPSTVISMRAAYGSADPADVFLPALIATAVCTGGAVLAYALLSKLCRP